MTATATKKRTAAASTAVDLAEQIGECQRQLEALEIEAEELPRKVQDAGHRGDAEAIVKARLRAQELPLYISATQVRLLRLRIQHCDLRVEQAEADLPDLEAAVAPLQERADEAMQALREAQGLVRMRRGDVQSANYDRGQHRLNLDRAIAEGSALPAHMRRPV